MGDVLSGGKIDESTSGPVPSKVDDRKTDILGEQKDKQDRSAIGGTQFPPRAQPPPPIPDAAQVIPALPSFQPSPPSFSSEVSIDTRETARQAVIDVLKNVTINGQGPSIEGSSISFNVPQETKQSEITFSQPAYQAPSTTPQQSTVSQQTQSPQPPQQSAQQAKVQAPQPEDNVISIVLEPPRKTDTPSYQSYNLEQPIQNRTPVKTTMPPQNLEGVSELKNVQGNTEFNQKTASSQPPKTETQEVKTEAENREPQTTSRLHADDFGSSTFNKQSDSAKAYQAAEQRKDGERPQSTDLPSAQKQESSTTSRLHAADFGSPNDLDKGQPVRESRLHAADFGSPNDLDKGQPVRESRLHAADFGSSKDLDKGQPEHESRLHAADFGSSGRDKQSDSAKAYQAAEQRRDEKRESDPNFDRQSRIRQEGESPKEFKERQEEIRKEKEMEKKAAIGDLKAALNSGMIPVALTRADGNKKILAYISSAFVGVTENPDTGERVVELPDETSYYKTGDGGRCGLEIYTKSVGIATNPDVQVWVTFGYVANKIPPDMSLEEFGQSIANSGSGDVWAEVNINGDTGDIESVDVNGGGPTPDDTTTSFYLTLGHYEYNDGKVTVSNYDCGSVYAVICRNWYALEAPFFGVNLSR